MKVEIKVLPELKEPYAVIYAGDITSEIRRAAALLEKETPDVIPVRENDSIIVLRPDDSGGKRKDGRIYQGKAV